jgi:hypothetical protein
MGANTLSEQPGQQDITSDNDPQTDSPLAEPEETSGVPAAVDMSAIHAATETHSAAVTAAHETLAQRLENAYSIFKSELANAYRSWENDVNEIKSAVGLMGDDIGGTGNGNGDPTRAV